MLWRQIHIGHFLLFICPPTLLQLINHSGRKRELEDSLLSVGVKLRNTEYMSSAMIKMKFEMWSKICGSGQKSSHWATNWGTASLHLSRNRRWGLQICSWPTLITAPLSHIQHIQPIMDTKVQKTAQCDLIVD